MNKLRIKFKIYNIESQNHFTLAALGRHNEAVHDMCS